MNIEPPDSAFFSTRARSFRLFSEQSPSVHVEQRHPHDDRHFSNRVCVLPSIESDPRLIPVGRGGGTSILNEYRPIIGAGRGRTTVPLSAFVLQKNNLPLPVTTKPPCASPPVFVMHDEVEFVRPYFGPPKNEDNISQLPSSHKRQILLSALKGIESGLKTL